MGIEARMSELQRALLRYEKESAVCPSCGTVFDPETIMRSRRGRSAPKAAVVETPAEVVVPAVEGEEADDVVIEDAEELGEDDAVEEVIEVEEEA